MTDGWRMVATAPGGPEAIARAPLADLSVGEDDVLVRHRAVGVNFIDTYHRSGLYPLPVPVPLGVEAAGVVEAAGSAVTDLRVGDRVVYTGRAPGSYATHRVVPAQLVAKLPDSLSFDDAAATFLKGLTAWMLIYPCTQLRAGQTVLVHAAAGGVGTLLVPWLKAIGATVIAHAGTAEKATLARQGGADHALSCPFDELATAVRDLTGGRGANVVLDGVGAASWEASLAATAHLGHIVSYGNASGPVPPIRLLDLARAGSLTVTRPTLFDYLTEAGSVQAAARILFDRLIDGTLPVSIGLRLPLVEAAEAHRALEARATTGSVLLMP